MSEADRVDKYLATLEQLAAKKELFLNPDRDLCRMLAEGLLRNKDKNGYASCPCCFASGDREKDADIICPCEESKKDLPENGICRCGLYVTRVHLDGLATGIAEGECPKDEPGN